MTNTRTLKDLNLQITKALPAAGASNNSNALDTANVNPGRNQDCELLIEVPATPNLANGATITLTVQDSPDNAAFAAQSELPPIILTGAGGVGAAAVARYFKFPITCGRYLRLNQIASAGGGDSTAVSSTLSIVF